MATDFEPVIGLEIHAQLATKTKIFCSCTSVFGAEPNTLGCPVCLGLPGALPVLNKRVVEMAVRMGLATGCTIARTSVFARKNYFYPDLPKGYQISQYDMPLCEHGVANITVEGVQKRIGITRIHLEEDAGKLIHDQGPDSLFDVNRCGTPLIEIVSDPEMHSPADAYAYLIHIKQVLEYLGVCDCNMEEGSLRCDANISLRPRGVTKLGTKVELKNMNTFRGVEKAIEYEIKRQTEVLSSGGTIIQQTYLWDANAGCTIPMRDKENAHDYRYFPDPDLVPLIVEEAEVERHRAGLPELPQARRERLIESMKLTPYAAEVLTDTRMVADYYESVVATCADAPLAANWVMGEVLRVSKDKKVEVDKLKVTPARLAQLITKVKDGTVSTQVAKKVLALIEEQDRDPSTIIKEQGMEQVSDTSALEQIIDKVLADSPKEIARYKAGEVKLTSFFVGQVMKASRGKGNPAEINRILAGKLS